MRALCQPDFCNQVHDIARILFFGLLPEAVFRRVETAACGSFCRAVHE
jgi:hypothetical protein